MFERRRSRKYSRIGDAARDVRNWMGARRAYLRALELDSSRTPIWVQYGHAAKECGDLLEAEAAYRSALALEPNLADAQNHLAHLLNTQERSRAGAESAVGAPGSTADPSGYMNWEDIERASAAFRTADGAPGSRFDEFRGKHLPLPSWYVRDLDPLSEAYLSQQDRLWQMMVGDSREYQPGRDELSAAPDSWVSSIVRPGLYNGSASSAGDHLIAMGHIVKHSNISPGDRVLEYGAGYGQIALTFARLGAEVHTVDVDPSFCAAVRTQAEHFKVALSAHEGRFGDNPAGGKYQLIVFYESFHHARSFVDLIARLREELTEGGRIVMAGEPIQPSADPGFARTCPYPWGIRLESEVAAIVRFRRWYELGFQEEFLLKLFFQNGFCFAKHPSNMSHYATVYVFSRRPKLLQMSEVQLPPTDESTWHARESTGRWTTARSTVTTDGGGSWSALRLDISNHHAMPVKARIELGEQFSILELEASSRAQFSIDRSPNAATLILRADAMTPSTYGVNDNRSLGLFVHSIEYI
jgi:SAM-dependent methyltransferase